MTSRDALPAGRYPGPVVLTALGRTLEVPDGVEVTLFQPLVEGYLNAVFYPAGQPLVAVRSPLLPVATGSRRHSYVPDAGARPAPGPLSTAGQGRRAFPAGDPQVASYHEQTGQYLASFTVWQASQHVQAVSPRMLVAYPQAWHALAACLEALEPWLAWAAVFDPGCDEQVLWRALSADVGPLTDELTGLVLAHPRCTEEMRTLHALRR